MTLNVLARHLFSAYEHYRVDHLTPWNCKHDLLLSELVEMANKSGSLIALEKIGSSIEERSIHLITIGRGQKKVLLWSQMHGDESTATLALMDMLNFLILRSPEEKWLGDLFNDLTLYLVPMLNPDGAERIDRRTAVGLDLNRDALDLATPEARVLRDIQRRLKPAFGFNLHDQELSSVGASKDVTAIALLAPALDEKKTKPPVRMRAMRVAALIGRTLGQFASGHLATYDDTFEPRAFGDNMQRWGTSTVLIESGHWPDDREKRFIRKLNYVGILTALRGIANGSFQDVDLDYYTHLPQNAKRIYDIIIEGIKLRHPSGWAHTADVGIIIDPLLNRQGENIVATVKDLGDLRTFGALKTIDGSARAVGTETFTVNQSMLLSQLLDILQLPH